MTLDEHIKQLGEKVHQRTQFLDKVLSFVLEATRIFGTNVPEEGSSKNIGRCLDTINNFRFEVMEKNHITIWHYDPEKQQDGAWEIVLKVWVPSRLQVETYTLNGVLEEELLRMAENQASLFEDLRKRAQIQQEQATELRRKQNHYGELLVEAQRLKIEIAR